MTLQDLENHSPGNGFYDVGDQLKQHVYRRSEQAFDAGDAARDAITTPAALEERQRALRQYLTESLGGLPASETPLEARTVGTVAGNGFRIEKVIFQSRPRNYVTANLYLPDGLVGPSGAVLFLCGHHREAKHVEEYQIVCQYLAQAGLIVLAQDPLGQGERLGHHEPALGGSTVPWGTNEHDHAGAQCLPLGDSIARYFLQDALRGVDYLCSRPEVDPQRIGVTGNSGGGTQTSLVMIADTRIAAAVPATFIMSRRSYLHAGGAQDAEQIWPGFSARGFDHEDILLAMTPRPVRVLAVTSDFFPIEGTRATVSRCKRFWEMYGRNDYLDLIEENSTHAFNANMARAAAAFFARHLLNRDAAFDEGSIAPFVPEQLWCMASGQVRGEITDAAFVHEANRERLEERARERSAVPEAERRARAVAWLREKVYRERRPCDLNPRFYYKGHWEDMAVQMCLWWSQEGLFSNGYAFRDFRRADQNLPVTLAIWDGGTNRLQPHREWLRNTCAAGRAVVVLDVSGAGALSPRSITASSPTAFYGVIHKIATDLLWLDDDLAALRTYDVLRALDMLAQWPNLDVSDVEIYAHGRHGLYGRLAALLEERIRRVEVADGMNSYADWVGARHYDTQDIYSVILRGVLRHFDLNEIEECVF